jgi:TetR/AcrR family transcriptional regulator, transcriptional repressor for nem operon
MARQKAFDQQRVLERAMDQFWCHGYTGTSIQDLVDAMGINRQSIYDTFGDKHHLFLQALQCYEATQGAELAAIFAQPGSGLDAIRRAFAWVIAAPLDQRTRGCLVVNSIAELAPQDQEATERLRSIQARIGRLMYEALVRAQRDGELDDARDLNALARYLTSSFNGLRLAAKLNPDRESLEQIAALSLAVLA